LQSNPTLDQDKTCGRKPALKFVFESACEIFDSHYLSLNSKLRLPILAGCKPPPYPVKSIPDGEEILAGLQRERDRFGAYVVANYWHWSRLCPPRIPHCARWPLSDLNPLGMQLSVDWEGFCILLDYLYDANCSFIHRGRRMEIENLAFGSRIHPIHGAWHKRAVTQYRYLAADNLLDRSKINPFGLSAERHRRDQ
jgi:hypothetical protein